MERPLRMLRRQALPLRLSGPIIEAALPEVAVGEIYEIRRHWRSREVIAHAQVLGFHRERTVLSLIGAAHGLSREMLLHPNRRPAAGGGRRHAARYRHPALGPAE